MEGALKRRVGLRSRCRGVYMYAHARRAVCGIGDAGSPSISGIRSCGNPPAAAEMACLWRFVPSIVERGANHTISRPGDPMAIEFDSENAAEEPRIGLAHSPSNTPKLTRLYIQRTAIAIVFRRRLNLICEDNIFALE